MSESWRVPSPGGWEAPAGVRPGWDWVPLHGASPRLHAIPWWARLWYRTPLVDRFAHEWMWWNGGWAVVPPTRVGDYEEWLRDRSHGSFERCRSCGKAEEDTQRLGVGAAAGRWLIEGSWTRPAVRTCANCGEQAGLVYTYGADGRGRLVTLASAFARFAALSSLSPMAYLLAAGFGAVVGLLATPWLGMSWWLIAALAVALTWLAAGIASRELGERWQGLLNAVDPSIQGVTAREHAALLRRYEKDPFPVYELDTGDWEGLRMLGGHSLDRGRLVSITLAYRRVPREEPVLSITTSRARVGRADATGEGPASGLDRLLRREILEHVPTIVEDSTAAEAPWEAGETAELTVDGKPSRALLFHSDGGWAAFVEVGEVVLSVKAAAMRPATVNLRSTSDVRSYLDALRDWLVDLTRDE